jgi:hypothetical protein
VRRSSVEFRGSPRLESPLTPPTKTTGACPQLVSDGRRPATVADLIGHKAQVASRQAKTLERGKRGTFGTFVPRHERQAVTPCPHQTNTGARPHSGWSRPAALWLPLCPPPSRSKPTARPRAGRPNQRWLADADLAAPGKRRGARRVGRNEVRPCGVSGDGSPIVSSSAQSRCPGAGKRRVFSHSPAQLRGSGHRPVDRLASRREGAGLANTP